MTDTTHKVFRAEKTTRNRDDFKVMMIGSMLGILMLLTLPVAGQMYDKFWADRPFVKASVEVIQTEDYQRPMVLYDADATQPATATWVAVIRDQYGNRLETRRGIGNYSTKEDNPRLWTWGAFFDNGTGAPAPIVPNQPFKICLWYISTANDTGVEDETPETCSATFHPELGDVKIIEEEDL